MARNGRTDLPNFATSSRDNLNVSSIATRTGIMGKNDGFSGVTVVKNTEIGFTGSNAGASAIFLPTAAIGSASFANGSGISLADLATDTMYPFNITAVSASTNTTVLVFKR
jgi:hypothetical protein